MWLKHFSTSHATATEQFPASGGCSPVADARTTTAASKQIRTRGLIDGARVCQTLTRGDRPNIFGQPGGSRNAVRSSESSRLARPNPVEWLRWSAGGFVVISETAVRLIEDDDACVSRPKCKRTRLSPGR